MFGITPFVISCLITSIGLASIRVARSRTVRLAGISITLWPFSLITPLRLASRPRRASGPGGLVGPHGSHHSTSRFTIREPGFSHGSRPATKRRVPPAPGAPQGRSRCAALGPRAPGAPPPNTTSDREGRRPALGPCPSDLPPPPPGRARRGSGTAWRSPDGTPRRSAEERAVGGAVSRMAQQLSRGRRLPRLFLEFLYVAQLTRSARLPATLDDHLSEFLIKLDDAGALLALLALLAGGPGRLGFLFLFVGFHNRSDLEGDGQWHRLRPDSTFGRDRGLCRHLGPLGLDLGSLGSRFGRGRLPRHGLRPRGGLGNGSLRSLRGRLFDHLGRSLNDRLRIGKRPENLLNLFHRLRPAAVQTHDGIGLH